jgi:predicted aldo/keto reductase-like oxidoreductase
MKTQGQRIGPPQNMPGGQQGRQSGPAGQSLQGQDGETMGPPPGIQAQDSSQEQDDLSAMSHFMDKGYTLEQAKLKVVWEDKRISVCLSEMASLAILKDNVAAAVDGIKLSIRDREVLDKYAQYNRTLYCQGCMQCESAMGEDCRIPDVLRYTMYYNSYGKTDEARRLFRELPEHVRNSMASRDYSPAERSCPNRIEIGKAMKNAAVMLG